MKLNKDNYNSKVFEKYKLLKTIDINREFKNGDILIYNNKDYEVIYKYNSDKGTHELYIDCICELIVSMELDDKISKLINTNE